MQIRPRRSACVLLLILAVTLTGCVGEIMEAGNKAKRRKENFEDLKQLGQAFVTVHNRRNSGAPKSWEDLQQAGLDSGLRDRLSNEGYTVVLGVDYQFMINGTSYFMLAFQRSAERDGGQVGFADGSVRVITAEEFKENMARQADNMKYAVIFEPATPVAESSGAGVISAPASGSSPGPPLPPTLSAAP